MNMLFMTARIIQQAIVGETFLVGGIKLDKVRTQQLSKKTYAALLNCIMLAKCTWHWQPQNREETKGISLLAQVALSAVLFVHCLQCHCERPSLQDLEDHKWGTCTSMKPCLQQHVYPDDAYMYVQVCDWVLKSELMASQFQ